jgi:hypothetical protein
MARRVNALKTTAVRVLRRRFLKSDNAFWRVEVGFWATYPGQRRRVWYVTRFMDYGTLDAAKRASAALRRQVARRGAPIECQD